MDELFVNNVTIDEVKNIVNTSPNAFISLSNGILNIFIGMSIAIILKLAYDKYETVSQYNKSLSNNFIPLTLITIFIISVVKSSLALSLGLVGALSIVRFRTAIKDPTELVYLFFCIAIGLGLGANQVFYTIFISTTIILILIFRKILFKGKNIETNNMFLEIELDNSDNNISSMIKELKKHSNYVSLIRHDYEANKEIFSLKVNFNSTYYIDQFKSSNWFKENVKNFSLYESSGLF